MHTSEFGEVARLDMLALSETLGKWYVSANHTRHPAAPPSLALVSVAGTESTLSICKPRLIMDHSFGASYAERPDIEVQNVTCVNGQVFRFGIPNRHGCRCRLLAVASE